MQSTTSTLPFPTGAQESLSPLIRRAMDTANESGRPVLLCCTLPFPNCDPLALMGEMASGTPFRFHWEQPALGFALSAGGTARKLTASGSGRFGDIASRMDAALATAVSGAASGEDCAGPFFLGGFSFFEALDENSWTGFDAAQLVVPEWLVLRTGEDYRAAITLRVHPGSGEEALWKRLAGVWVRLSNAAGAAALNTPAQPRNRAFHGEEREDGRRQWMEMVRLAIGRIREGQLSKVVLARALDLVCEEPPVPGDMLRRLREAYPDCYNFMIDPGGGKVFLGASPERMARFNNGTVDLTALAGTMPRGERPEADAAYARQLLESRKEHEEHQIVVDDIVQAVAGLGTLRYPPAPRIVKLTNVQHLHTPLTLELKQRVPMLALLERIHPTAAVGGHPREEAFRIIRESERFDRGWYGAPVGWMNACGQGEFAVALRSGVQAGERLRLFAGCGIVGDSDPEREYEETLIKFQPLLSALANE